MTDVDDPEEPFLVFRRTGRTIGAVLALGFGGGTVGLGVATAFSGPFELRALGLAVQGYGAAALPFIVCGLLLARCRRELWFVPSAQAFHMVTYRPWLVRGPRVEACRLDEYRAILCERREPTLDEPDHVVSLITVAGEHVAVREFDSTEAARTFVEALAAATGLARS